jgi:short-subunit dehydrogenase
VEGPHWQGQSAIVTGASSGIGSAIAAELADAGARLVLTGRRLEALEEVAGRCRELGAAVHTLACDLTAPTAREELALLARREYGALDLLVNNAGVTMNARFSELAPEVLRTIFEINFFAAVELTRLVLPDLEARRGRILVISSVTGLVGTPTRTAYAASKHALHGLFDALRVEMRDHGIGVTIACPGYVATPMRMHALLADGSPQGHDQAAGRRMLTPEEVSRRVLRAAWHRKRLVKMGTETYLARALSLVAPGLLERILARATR